MKLGLFIFSFSLSSLLFGQIPDYFNANQEWISETVFFSPGITNCTQNTNSVYYVNGDTLIGNVSYKKIGRRFLVTYTPMTSNPCPPQSWGDVACDRILRQSQDSIIEYDTQNGTELLLLNYNVTVGSTFPLTSFVTTAYTVEQIDILPINGQNHRVFHLDTMSEKLVIEGVGHGFYVDGGFIDFFGFGPNFDFTARATCYAQNGTTFWTNPNFPGGSCNYLDDLSIGEIDPFQLQLAPNPATNVVAIKSNGTIVNVRILALDGKQVWEQTNDSGITNIEIDHLSNGSYLLLVQDASGNRAVQKFQKTD